MEKAPQPIAIEWGKKYHPFENFTSQLMQSKKLLAEIDPLGSDGDDEGVYIEGHTWPDTKYLLPTNQLVTVKVDLLGLQALKQLYPKTFPWGGEIHTDFSEQGRMILTEYPLVMNIGWDRRTSQRPEHEENVSMTISGKSKKKVPL